MIVFIKNILSFALGAVGYGMLEIAVRGYTHWTMLLTAGTVFSLFMLINQSRDVDIIIKALLGAVIITGFELGVGSVVNLTLGWNIWDYSGFSHNIRGQICLRYSALWFVLSIPAFSLCGLIERKLSFR